MRQVNQYLVIKTTISLVTGVLVTLWLWWLDVDFPVLWGLIAMLMNYIPNVGSLIAAIPAVLLSLVQLGVSDAIFVASGYLVINIIMGNLIEPRFMGKGLGLSPLVVFLSLILWGWLFGPVGMFLSIPLTMIVKIALEQNESTRWIAIMLGNEAPATNE
ncbi:AI-2E family transporter [Nitrincola nitratireducens]|uniref:Transport of quorum-sensing signal protein n=1 Tax=Nitrincola nitratireducens TaxID=1229521 RepID=W9UZX5_9GAMM|nr:AI-2E family transporter [Nitrincola nitratireducens]EXJ12798.1 Transport of quorum-sensing signal protein [Nitrincola nitratireducens]